VADYRIAHLGAEDCVTGSCQLLQFNEFTILVDCGLVQGKDS
jgi:metallo-beta-lactamase family protein